MDRVTQLAEGRVHVEGRRVRVDGIHPPSDDALFSPPLDARF